MKEIIKSKSKIIIAFILGLLLSGVTVYATSYAFAGNQVSFDNTTANLKKQDNSDVETIQEAIDAIYTKTNGLQTQLTTCTGNLTTAQSKMATYHDEICPGCVYRKSTTINYNSNATGANGTNIKLSSSEYTTDYTTLNSNYFLGHVIDSNGYILSSYACGINNGTFFCLRGVDSNQSSLTYKPFYQEGVNVLNKAFPGCNANTSKVDASCSGGVVGASVRSTGTVAVFVSGDGYCSIGSDGGTMCG